jgi:dihydroorotate dehydrogenase electron transfer subunit
MQTQITVVEKETIASAWWRMIIAAPELASRLIPGQFLLVRCADLFSCYLRRPIFPTSLGDEHIALLIRPQADPGLAWLSARQPGDELDVIGPLGRGFPLADHLRNLLLVADGPAIDPLLGVMTMAMEAGVAVTLALGGSRAAALFPVNRLPSAVEVQFATRDGSLGHRGSVTDLLPDLLRWADAVYTVGSTRLYLALKDRVRAIRLAGDADFLYGLVAHTLLPCGVGTCLACTVPASDGSKLICVDGPVFDLMALDLGI